MSNESPPPATEFYREPAIRESTMSQSPSHSPPLLNWLAEQFAGEELAPSRRSQKELADLAERLVHLHLSKSQPLRPAAMTKRLATLSRNLNRAAKAAAELGEPGVALVVLESAGQNTLEAADDMKIIAHLHDWALWSSRAAKTARLMKLSALDHKGGRTPDFRLRSLVTLLMDRYEHLLGVRATHVVDPETGLGHGTFDLFVKEAIRLHAPAGTSFEPRRIDEAIRSALPSRSSTSRRAKMKRTD